MPCGRNCHHRPSGAGRRKPHLDPASLLRVRTAARLNSLPRWGRVGCDGENLLDATCPLLLQTSLKLYGIAGPVVSLLTFIFEGWARSRSSPTASAQYISASFRYRRLSRSDFAMTVRRANSFAFAR